MTLLARLCQGYHSIFPLSPQSLPMTSDIWFPQYLGLITKKKQKNIINSEPRSWSCRSALIYQRHNGLKSKSSGIEVLMANVWLKASHTAIALKVEVVVI